MADKPYRVLIKGKPVGNWKANVNGKVVDLGEGDALSADQAFDRASRLTEQSSAPTGPTIGKLFEAASNGGQVSPKPEVQEDTKSKPGELRKEGLAELSPALLKKFRETFAAAIADGNYSLDRALIGIFGYIPPNIPEDSKALLKIGWELACQKYFTDGVPPPWIVILFANVQIIAKLADGSKKKPTPEEKAKDGKPGTTTGNPNDNDLPEG